MPGQLRGKGFVPPQTDVDWVRDGLLLLKSACEWPGCSNQALHAHDGKTAVAYLCDMHNDIVKKAMSRQVWLDNELWELFRDLYDFVRQAENSSGELFALIDAREAQAKELAKQAERETRKEERQAVSLVRKHIAKGRVGVPDDELATARGAQSPPRAPGQFVFRTPEPAPPDPVVLPKVEKPDLLIVGWLI